MVSSQIAALGVKLDELLVRCDAVGAHDFPRGAEEHAARCGKGDGLEPFVCGFEGELLVLEDGGAECEEILCGGIITTSPTL